MDNANLLKAPGYELVNLNVHYKTDLASDYFKSLSLFSRCGTCSTRTYIASANNIANTVTRRPAFKIRRACWRTRPARSMPDRRARSSRE